MCHHRRSAPASVTICFLLKHYTQKKHTQPARSAMLFPAFFFFVWSALSVGKLRWHRQTTFWVLSNSNKKKKKKEQVPEYLLELLYNLCYQAVDLKHNRILTDQKVLQRSRVQKFTVVYRLLCRNRMQSTTCLDWDQCSWCHSDVYFFLYNCIFLMINNNQRSHTHTHTTLLLIYIITLLAPSAWPRARRWTLKLPWLRASTKRLKCKITVLSSLMSLGYSGVWRRTMTQTVWGDDICPVRT